MSPTLSLERATLASAIALTENGNKPIDILMQLNTAMIVYACGETIEKTHLFYQSFKYIRVICQFTWCRELQQLSQLGQNSALNRIIQIQNKNNKSINQCISN